MRLLYKSFGDNKLGMIYLMKENLNAKVSFIVDQGSVNTSNFMSAPIRLGLVPITYVYTKRSVGL